MADAWGGSWGVSWGTSWIAAIDASQRGDDAPFRRRRQIPHEEIIRIVEMIEAQKKAEQEQTQSRARRKRQRRKIEKAVSSALASSAPWASLETAQAAVREITPDFQSMLMPSPDAFREAEAIEAAVRRYMDEAARIAWEMQEEEDLLLLAA